MISAFLILREPDESTRTRARLSGQPRTSQHLHQSFSTPHPCPQRYSPSTLPTHPTSNPSQKAQPSTHQRPAPSPAASPTHPNPIHHISLPSLPFTSLHLTQQKQTKPTQPHQHIPQVKDHPISSQHSMFLVLQHKNALFPSHVRTSSSPLAVYLLGVKTRAWGF